MRIRKASKGDLHVILRLVGEQPEKLMQEHLPRTNSFFVATEKGKIIGCCALQVYSKRLAEIRSLAVTEKFQGKGVATALIRSCLMLAEKKGVYEVLTITSATRLFEKHGFGTFNRERFALIKILGE